MSEKVSFSRVERVHLSELESERGARGVGNRMAHGKPFSQQCRIDLDVAAAVEIAGQRLFVALLRRFDREGW